MLLSTMCIDCHFKQIIWFSVAASTSSATANISSCLSSASAKEINLKRRTAFSLLSLDSVVHPELGRDNSVILKSINLLFCVFLVPTPRFLVSLSLSLCVSPLPLFYTTLPNHLLILFLGKTPSKSKPCSTSASLTSVSHPFPALLSSIFIYFNTQSTEFYNRLKMNMQQYIFIHNIPCFGQQVKDHHALDTTDIMCNLQTVTE